MDVDPNVVVIDICQRPQRLGAPTPGISPTFEFGINGVGGWVDDDLAIVRPWGFNLNGIQVPVLIRYGLSDVLVPPAHGQWLAANVPGCLVKVDGAAGHLGADPEEEIAENIQWLSAGVRPDGAEVLCRLLH